MSRTILHRRGRRGGMGGVRPFGALEGVLKALHGSADLGDTRGTMNLRGTPIEKNKNILSEIRRGRASGDDVRAPNPSMTELCGAPNGTGRSRLSFALVDRWDLALAPDSCPSLFNLFGSYSAYYCRYSCKPFKTWATSRSISVQYECRPVSRWNSGAIYCGLIFYLGTEDIAKWHGKSGTLTTQVSCHRTGWLTS
jgi:hypothetical protein